MGVAVRPRRTPDLEVLLPVLQRTHEQEGYPVRPEAVSDWWLAPADGLGAWVAEVDGRVVGHVGLLPARGPSLPVWTSGSGREPDGLAVVARLFTDRTARGAGTALLERSVQEARARGRAAVLEVDVLSPAHAFYLRRGWTALGTVVQQWGPRTVTSAALLAPGA